MGPEPELHSKGWYVQQTSDGGYIVIGETYKPVSFDTDAYLIKTDTYGKELWSKTFGGGGVDTGFQVQQTADGGYILIGETSSFSTGGYYDMYLIYYYSGK
jgi:hypothetical protein